MDRIKMKATKTLRHVIKNQSGQSALVLVLILMLLVAPFAFGVNKQLSGDRLFYPAKSWRTSKDCLLPLERL